MWLATVTLAIQDSLLPLGTRRASTGLDVREARRWLSTDSRDLRLVLELASLEPGWFLTRAVPALRARWPTPGWVRPAAVAASRPGKPARARFGVEGHLGCPRPPRPVLGRRSDHG
jgi:hypothetical protein